jgi:hypothetical protein
MVSVEVAIALPVVLLVAVAGLWLLALGQLEARLTDAARATAREVARGVSPPTAIERGHQVEPRAQIVVQKSGSDIEVRATRVLKGPGPVLGALEHTVRVSVHTASEEQ